MAIEEAIGTHAIVHHCTAQLLKGEPMELPSGQSVSISEYVALRNCARRDRELFGWEPAMKDVTPSIAEFITRRTQERATAAQAGEAP